MRILPQLITFLLPVALLLQCTAPGARQPVGNTAADPTNAYVGTYTRDEGWVHGKAEGIYRLTFADDGSVVGKELIDEVVNPSFVLESADGKYLYAVSELARADEPTGYLHMLEIGKDHATVTRLSTEGKAPCHIAEDRTGRWIVTSTYVGGTARLFRRTPAGLLEATDLFVAPRDLVPGKVPHLHSARFAPDNRTVAVADLGLDRVWLFTLDAAAGKLLPHPQGYVAMAAGAGPRHTEWSADGRFLYVINELDYTVSVVAHDAAADRFTVAQTLSTLPADYDGKNSCADVHLHPNGRFLYGSNRGHNSIAIFSVDAKTGRLAAAGHHPTGGDFPRNFAIAPGGKTMYVANQNTDNVTVHTLDPKTGQLTATGQSFAVPTPVCLDF